MKMLTKAYPKAAKTLLDQAQINVNNNWKYYEQLAGLHYSAPTNGEDTEESVN